MIQESHSWSYIQEKKKKENSTSKRNMHPNIHSSTGYNCQDIETT